MPRRSTRVAATTTFGSSRDLVFGSMVQSALPRGYMFVNGVHSLVNLRWLMATRLAAAPRAFPSSGYLALLPMGRSLHSFHSQASEKCVISRWLECTTSCSHGGGEVTRCFLFDDILLLCAALLCLRSDDLLWYRSGGVSKSLHIGREVSKRKNRYFTGRLRSTAEDRTQSPRCRTARS